MEQLFQEKPVSQAVDRGAQLLVSVLAAERPLGVTELALATELPKSTVSRLLGVLERHGLVAQDGERGALRPGPAILTYAQRGLYERNIIALAESSLEVLAAASGETINLAVPGPGGVEHLSQADGRHFLGAGQWVGRRVDYHCTAVGKVFLAFGAARLPSGPLEAHAPATIVTRDALETELRRVESRGHAAAIDELEPGLAAIAAPVRGGDGRVVAALSITGPTLRLGAGDIERLLPLLRRESELLSGRLGHTTTGEHAA
ncbi:MAG TPA: IclR family transcriptional regulator [Solirubrobacteraceae bacterium]|jgi:DNA-binding IclR family transcriptional regulator